MLAYMRIMPSDGNILCPIHNLLFETRLHWSGADLQAQVVGMPKDAVPKKETGSSH